MSDRLTRDRRFNSASFARHSDKLMAGTSLPGSVLLQVHRHDHVKKVSPSLKKPRTVGGRKFQRNLVAVHDLERVGKKAGVKADLDVGAFEFAREVHGRLAGLGRAAC